MAKTTTPSRKKRKASEATTAAASDDGPPPSMSKAEKRAEALRRAQEYRDRLKAKKQGRSGGGSGAGSGGGGGSSPSPKKKKAAGNKVRKSPARKSKAGAASNATTTTTPTRATRSRVAQRTPDTVPKSMPTSAGRGKGKRGGAGRGARGTRGRASAAAAVDTSDEEEDNDEEEMDVDSDEQEEGVDADKKANGGDEEASFSSDDERTAQARSHGTPRKRRKVGRSPPKNANKAKANGDGSDTGKGETAAERRARKAEEERRAREWRERKYHSPPSNANGNGNGNGNASSNANAAASSPPRRQPRHVPAPTTTTTSTSPVAHRPRPRPRPVAVAQNGHAAPAPAPAPEPVHVQQMPQEEEIGEDVIPQQTDQKDQGQGVLGKYPYLMILLFVCAPLGIGMLIGSSGLARPANLKDFTDELGGMLAETKRNLLPGQKEANSQLFRCLADSPDVPAVEHHADADTNADEEGGGATRSSTTTTTSANSSGDASSWWTKTPPALLFRTTSKTCAGSANPLPCPRHGRCAHGFLVDCKADDAIAGRSDLFAVSEESFTACVLSPEAKQIVSAIQGKVIDLSIEQKCNVSCRWGVGVPFISSTMTPKERCGGIDPDDVMAVRSKDDAVDYFFSVNGLVGAMNHDNTSAANPPTAGTPAISSEIVQLLSPHLDEGIIKYFPGSSASLTPRIGLAIDFVNNKLDEYLPFSCWFPTKVREAVLFLLGLVVVFFSWIFRFIRANPGRAFYIFLASEAAQHLYLWVERRLITREAKIVVELVRNELAAHPQGAAVRQLHVRDDIGQTHDLYAGSSTRAGIRRKWMYRKVWKRVKNEIERDRRFRSEKRRTERGRYMEYWVVEFKGRRG